MPATSPASTARSAPSTLAIPVAFADGVAPPAGRVAPGDGVAAVTGAVAVAVEAVGRAAVDVGVSGKSVDRPWVQAKRASAGKRRSGSKARFRRII
jgi:hypothetical protein